MATTKTTQDFIPIREIRNNTVILENGQLSAVLLASSINFALKASNEQNVILGQFQTFLNTLDFSLQLHIESRRLDIRPYLALLKSREGEQYNDLMRVQLREYTEFIKAFTSEVSIMSKSFFVIIPYTPINTNVRANIRGILGQRERQRIDDRRFEEYRTQLDQRVTVVEQGLRRIGIKTIPLGDEELIELYYHILNPNDLSSAPKRE